MNGGSTSEVRHKREKPNDVVDAGSTELDVVRDENDRSLLHERSLEALVELQKTGQLHAQRCEETHDMLSSMRINGAENVVQ